MQKSTVTRHRRVLTGVGTLTVAALTLTGCGDDSSSSSGNSSSSTTVSSSGSASSSGSPSSTSSPAASGSSSSSSSSSAGKTGPYTMAQVKTHNSKSSCWAVIDKNVYNLTSWISKHPGGADKIVQLCGTDATAKFKAQHGSDKEPKEKLAAFKIGKLAN